MTISHQHQVLLQDWTNRKAANSILNRMNSTAKTIILVPGCHASRDGRLPASTENTQFSFQHSYQTIYNITYTCQYSHELKRYYYHYEQDYDG